MAHDSLAPFSVSDRPLMMRIMGYYKAAIALNNEAVNLLCCGFYQQALQTIKVAINLMMDIAERLNGAAASEVVSEADLHQRLERAWARVAACKEELSAAHPHPLGAPPEDPIIVWKVVSSEYNPAIIYAAVATVSTSNGNVKFPMTIHGIDSNSIERSDSDDGDLADVDFHSSVILYNYGIAHECLAAVATLTTTTAADSLDGCIDQVVASQQLQLASYSIHRLACNLLYNQFLNGRESFFTIGSRLQLETFLTCSLIQACVQLGVAHQDHVKNLEEILILIDARERVLPTTEHNCARAA